MTYQGVSSQSNSADQQKAVTEDHIGTQRRSIGYVYAVFKFQNGEVSNPRVWVDRKVHRAPIPE